MRTWKEAEQAGTAVGFELVSSHDIATAAPVCGPWCTTPSLPPACSDPAPVDAICTCLSGTVHQTVATLHAEAICISLTASIDSDQRDAGTTGCARAFRGNTCNI